MSTTMGSHARQPRITRRAIVTGVVSLATVTIAASQMAALLSASNTEAASAATPTSEDSNSIEVRLSPGLGNEWCVYSGQLSATSLERVGEATIANVTNRTNKRIVLIHWDSAGARIGPISLNVNAAADAFNGMPIAGVWEAHVSGSEVDAPQRITLDVAFEKA